MIDQDKTPKIDENLYSRQIFVLGMDTMKKLATGSVLISGMGGLGVEIAKNVILAGVKNVTIQDTKNTEMYDLASNFYLTEESIGKNRALESFHQLSNLNEYVTVSAKTDDLTEDFIKNYNCVVITDYNKESEIKRISNFCHENKIKLILTEARGLFAYLFTDFGSNFIVTDPTGEPPSRFLLSFVTNSENGLVTIDEDDKHDLGDGDHVIFEEVEGMTELNGKEFEVKVVDTHHFKIGDTRNFGKYTSQHRNGYGNKVILPRKYEFLELTEALKNPLTMQSPFDFCTFGQDQQVILSFIAAQHYLDQSNKTTPEVTGDELLESAKEVNSIYKIVDEIDENLIREFARESGSVINPTCATFGGIVGQEVIKSLSGKFGPIHQFLAMGYTACLPKDTTYELKHDRYDPYRIVFGNQQQEVMEKLRYFIVGAGAIGCEQLKNFALMGVATKDEGQIYVTDMDSIERSNLNRQFLFRNKDIGKMKSDVAAEAAKLMNPSIKIISQQNRLGLETRSFYNDSFYDNIDGVCNALDNLQTRLYTDQMCVLYNKPLLESGTLGTKAHYQIIIPKMTESYASQADPQENGIGICSVHNYPSTIVECTAWLKNAFVELFEQNPQLVHDLLIDQNYIENTKKNDLQKLETALKATEKFLIDEKCDDFNDCIKWARLKFEEFFNFKIRHLTSLFPEDAIGKDGLPFWTGKKRFPSPATYDPNNHYHAQFVESAALIRARICGIKPEENVNIPQIADKVEVPDDIKTEQSSDGIDYEAVIQEIKSFIEKARKNLPKPETFEKDDDSNGHMNFIVLGTNIRAANYQIAPETDLEIKRIAGNITPAIATTTAMICGLVALEMYKVHCYEKDKKINDFRFGVINLAIPSFCISEPKPCKITESNGGKIKFSLWDKWIIEGDLTVDQFIKQVKEKYDINAEMISKDKKVIYPDLSNPKNSEKRLNEKITNILVNILNMPPLSKGQNYIDIECLCSNDDDEEVETPTFCLKVK